MRENRTGKYLKYALGEIILVVIGILIALTINNWKDDQLKRTEEKLFIQNLIVDLKSDSIQLSKIISESQKAAQSKLILEHFFTKQEVNIDSITQHFQNQLLTGFQFVPKKTSIEELRSGSGLSIIQDHYIQREIIDLYNFYNEFAKTESFFFNKYVRFQEALFPIVENVSNLTLDEVHELKSNKQIRNMIRFNFAGSRHSELTLALESCCKLLIDLRKYFD